MNLAVKYRPKTFEDVSEQTLIVQILKNICNSDVLDNRNFLLIGPAGTGKTTLGRIIANVLNNGQGEPIEVDAASHGGVDSVREIVQQARSYPVGCKYKVFICDECFPGYSLVRTTSGLVPIKDIKPGTRIYNLTGESTVTHVFRNKVKVSNLIYLRVSGNVVVTTKDHLFFTDEGWVCAKDLKQGDILYDYETMQTMRKIFRGQVSERYEDVLQQGLPISCDIRTSGSTYIKYTEELSYMWERFLDSSICRCDNLLSEVLSRVEKATSQLGMAEKSTCRALAVIYLSDMRTRARDSSERSSSSMLSSMRRDSFVAESSRETFEAACDETMRKLREFISSELRKSKQEDLQQRVPESTYSLEESNSTSRNICKEIEDDEIKQSVVFSRSCKETNGDEAEKWYVDSKACYALWKRTLFKSADSFETRIGRRMDIRVCHSDNDNKGQQSESLSYELQSRPRLTKIETSDRGGWDRPQWEISTVIRRKEGKISREFRVDRIEVYQRGHNDESFQSCFPDTEICNAEYVDMFDLQVAGHPSYFIEDILVHNCHSFSNTAWQALLKTLEENPAMSIFVLCTTNPEKIPATILSRVQTFQLSKISLDGITKRLIHVIECEKSEGRNITYTEDAVNFIAKLANGGMRDALTLLDKALSYSENITSENLSQSLNLPNYDDYFELLNAYAKKDNGAITRIIDRVYNSGVNFVRWFEGFHSFVINVVKYIFLQDIGSTMIPGYYYDKISKYGVAHSIVCLSLANKLLKLISELKTTQYLQEVALTHLCSIPKKG